MENDDHADLKPIADATAGATGALLTTVLLSPIDVAKTRIQANFSTGDGTLATLQQIVAADGIAGLYKGIGTTVTRAAVLGATKMATYDVVKTELRNNGWAEGPGLVFGVSGLGYLFGV